MSQLNNIVNVDITVQSSRISRASFSAALLLAKTQAFAGDAKAYTALADMVTDGFLTTDAAYLAAADYFSQENGAETLIIGRRAQTATLTVTAASTFLYSVTIGGVAYTFTSGSGATMAEIRTGLNAAINAATATHGYVAANVSTNQISLTPETGKVGANVTTLSANLVLATTVVTTTIAADLTRIQTANTDWYAIVLVDRDNTDATSVATWVASASNPHVFVYASADANIVDSSSETTSLAYSFKVAGYRRSWVFYHSLAATRYPDAALFGKILALEPGSYSVKFKSLDNMPVDELTDTQCANARAKYAMMFIAVAGRNILQEGVTAEGEFIDVIIFIDWLTSITTENVFLALSQPLKVPYTDAGIAVVEAAVRASVQSGVDAGGLAGDPAPTFTVPSAASVSPADKAARRLRNVRFTAKLAGAIHFVEINGFVSV